MRILLVADTHIDFDLPQRQPHVTRRRRGDHFLDNFRLALEPALRGEVDLVVHGGDLLFRSKVPPGLVEMTMTPLIEVGSRGIPVYLVSGNHERSRIPLHLWATHPGIHIFDRPRSFLCQTSGRTIALCGFPYIRDIRDHFASALEETGFSDVTADAAILCIHQAVEGAQVGPADFTFRNGLDVIRGRQIPDCFGAILSGHIHRAQVLTLDLSRAPLAAPVIYSGSVERISWAECEEEKVFAILTVDDLGSGAGVLSELEWVPLPARPMVDVRLQTTSGKNSVEAELRSGLSKVPVDAVVLVHFMGAWAGGVELVLSAANLRALAPSTMNISLARDRQ